MGGRLHLFLTEWSSIAADSWVLSVIKDGLPLEFESLPLLSRSPIHFYQNHPDISRAILLLLEKGAVERVLNPQSPGFYSRLFLVPKKDGSLRPVIDLSHLNRFLTKEKFKMETVRSVIAAVRPADFAVSIDLSDAYFHVGIRHSFRKYLRFTDGISVFQFKALPFGLSSAPRVFTRIMLAVASCLRSQGIRLLQYLDDWLFLSTDRQTLLSHLRVAVSLVTRLGLVINPEKSETTPSQDFVFVGIRFLTRHNLILVPPPRVTSILSLVQVFLRRSTVSARYLLSLLGVLNSAAELIPLGRLHLRPLQFYLLSLWRPRSGSLEDPIHLSPLFHQQLRWWSDQVIFRGVPLSPPMPSLFLFTDASLEGWGAHLEPVGLCTSGLWSRAESLLHINVLELEAVSLALQFFLAQVRGHSVLISSDNMTVVSYLRRQGGTHSLSLFRRVRDLLLWCQSQDIIVSVRHLPGRLNVLADRLSRSSRPLVAEWTLSRPVLSQVFHHMDTPTLDLFATRWNNRLPLYVSPVLDPAAFAVDAMSLDWDSLFGYAFPPFTLIPVVLRKIRSSASCCIILIAPLWPKRSWFTDLLDLLIDHPVPLPVTPDLLSQPPGRFLHPNPGLLRLHAWKLSSVASDRQNFLDKLPPWSPNPDGSQLLESMTLSGLSSAVGVTHGKLVLPHHLFSR